MSKKEDINKLIEEFKTIKIKPNELNNEIISAKNSTPIVEGTSVYALLKRPELDYQTILDLLKESNITLNTEYPYLEEVLEQVEIEIKYEGYISKALQQANKMRSYESKPIPSDIDYDNIDNIALEAREKLKKVRPLTIGQASRISGVNPADISVLVVYVEKMLRG